MMDPLKMCAAEIQKAMNELEPDDPERAGLDKALVIVAGRRAAGTTRPMPTLRDMFAGHAMQLVWDEFDTEDAAAACYEIADAMLEARER